MNQKRVAIFDFLSHANMHLPFNEGYVRLVRHAFPEAQISFHAHPDHLRNLANRFADLAGVTLIPCPPMTIPFGFSRHNPIAGRYAAGQSLNELRSAASEGQLELAAVLGVDANLLAVLRSRWAGISSAPLHMILHNHLSAAVAWRSRNPYVRAFDFVSTLKKPLPKGQGLVALELGIASAVVDLAPALAGSVVTLEHPILASQWVGEKPPLLPTDVVKIAFVGHASRGKGFDSFVRMSQRAGPGKEFHSIGIGAPEAFDMDLGRLTRAPTRTSLPTEDYLNAMGEVDVVCLPLGRGYDFVASGSVIDAIAGLKPLFSLRNRSVDGIFQKYGPIGRLFDSVEALEDCVTKLTAADVAAEQAQWRANLVRIRQARLPEILGPVYRDAVSG